MKKRILAFFLTGIMTFTMVPAEAFAAVSQKQENQSAEEVMAQEETAKPEEAREPEAVLDETTGSEEAAEGEEQKKDEQGVDEQINNKLDETAELLTEEEPEESAENLKTLDEWTPPVGGVEETKVVEISDSMANSLGIVDEEKDIDMVEGTMVYNSATVGSQKYDSSWDIYSSNYVYNHLSSKEKDFWDLLDSICRNYLTKTTNAQKADVQGTSYYITEKGVSYVFSDITANRAGELFFMFSYANPQYYFISNGYLSGGGAIFPIIYDAFANGTARKSETTKVKAQIDAMETQIAKGSTEVEKAQIAHDLIIKKVKYDHDYDSSTPNTIYHQSAYSVLRENYTVCAGYAKAFEILMNGAGIDAISVTSAGHAWNLVCLNDSWYQVDCTWDDTDGQYEGYGEMFYLYFNRSTAKITGELDQNGYHQVESCYKGMVPKCTLDSGATYTSIGTYTTPSAAAAAPKISQKKTTSGIQITLSSATAGAEIYYTLDGKTPSSSFSRSFCYTKPFKVTSDVTVKAVAVCNTKWNSSVASAKVAGKMYTVKFNTMGGKKISSQKVYSGSLVTKPSNPKRAGYLFAGWYKDKKYKTTWNFKTTKVSKNITLYAKWKKISVPKTSVSKLTNVSGKKMKVTIKKVSGVNGYQIRYAANSSLKSPKKVSIKSNSTTISKLSKGKKYYVQVRAYKTDSAGKRVYGKWSSSKAVTISK